MSDRYPLEGWVGLKAEQHRPDEKRGGCTCGFCAWSVEHVAIMAYRDAIDSVPVPDSTPTERDDVVAVTLTTVEWSILRRGSGDQVLELIAAREQAAWAEALRNPYDEDGYCEGCGNGSWKAHAPECGWADLRDARAEAWDEGYGAGRDDEHLEERGFELSHVNPYRADPIGGDR